MKNEAAGNDLPENKQRKLSLWRFLSRGLFWIVTGSILLVFALVAVLFFIRDTVVVRTVTGVGSYLTGTAVMLESFQSSLAGTIELRGLKVGNPPGYHNDYALELDRISLRLVPGTLFKEVIEIKEIRISGVRVTYEPVFNGSNLQDIQRHLAEAAGNNGESDGAESREQSRADAEEEKKAGRQVVVHLLTIDDHAVSLASPALKASFTLPLPPVSMTDIGGKKESAAAVFLLLYDEMLQSVFSALGSAGGAVASALDDAAKAAGRSMSSAGEAVFYSLDGAVRKAGDGVGEAGKRVADSVGNIFGGLFDGKTEEKTAEKPQKSEKNEKNSKNNLQKSK